MKISDLYWLAGLLEGEGCFKSSGNGVSIILGMTDLDVVLRAQSIFGPEAHLQAPRVGRPGTKPMNYLQINSDASIEWMKKLRPLMGKRRQAAIDKAIEKWKTLPGRGGWNKGRSLGRKALCHPDRPHFGRGYCGNCHQNAWRKLRKKGVTGGVSPYSKSV